VLAGSHAEAAAAYAAIGARPEEAKARLRASTALARSGDRAAATEHLERARDFYAGVGAEAYVNAGQSMSAVVPG
jgi:hypothetical protein